MGALRELFAGAIVFVWGCCPAAATTITVNYTGTYSGNWSGNYDPRNPQFLPNGPNSGSMGSGQFALTFIFDTSLAIPGHFDSTRLDNLASGFLTSPSVGSGNLYPLNIAAGAYYALDSATAGQTTQTVYDRYFGRGGPGISPTISMTATNPIIQPDILTPFKIESPVPIGTGYASYWYENTFLGGGIVTYYLTPFTIEVLIDPAIAAVPEPSTWAMLLIGFGGLGFAAYRRRLTAKRRLRAPPEFLQRSTLR